ncbi:hypothetical protein PsorP6_018851 [Peronosclerospora sorghi]|nr:hypothetical protein PsorP6_018811 [Peronosclerospora sorghi]KAI9895313.1 hypothetical protein PsorP6_018851 [Peronosclerospora sorghi]
MVKQNDRTALEDSLRCLVSYHGADGNKYMPLVGKPSNPVYDVQHNASSTTNDDVNSMLTTREKSIEQAQENLKKEQQRQKKYYDKKRANMEFKEEDLVLLSTENLNIRHQTTQQR